MSETMLAERTRIVGEVFDHAHDMADAGLRAIIAQIPAYADRDEVFLADVHDQLTRLCRTGLAALLDHRKITADDVAYARHAAARRAQAGLTLVDYINAFRLGQHAMWQSLMNYAGASEAGREAALSMVVPLTRYCDLISTQAANAYLEFQQYLSEEAGRDARELVETLLDGAFPERGPQYATAAAHGLGTDEPGTMVVVTGRVLDATDSTRHQVSAAIARTGVNGLRTLSVVRGGEIVAIPALGRNGSAEDLCDRLRDTGDRLRAEGVTVALGVSTVAAEAAQLPAAYQEARGALDLLPQAGGVLALPTLTPLRYLMLRADDTARRLVDTRIGAALADDLARGGMLTATVRAFAEADMNLRAAAEHLRVHHNTAKYRVRRIQELTGRDVRRVADLVELLVAIDLLAPPGATSTRPSR
ncbi:helix-turn-helix domain-containing protein [Nocardia puris]|nr:helix-turn-helix domain-containing protein [Nocardia puris]MBF6212271.1 helix-turn-helix domain-containing protein [Nocardia puris]MBF6366518.1 helix-turn-helix domain-containing protein [Nocardia puris]MBF6460860.1 helix-turn-helix domain-containing protein [Nocardia puris]